MVFAYIKCIFDVIEIFGRASKIFTAINKLNVLTYVHFNRSKQSDWKSSKSCKRYYKNYLNVWKLVVYKNVTAT